MSQCRVVPRRLWAALPLFLLTVSPTLSLAQPAPEATVDRLISSAREAEARKDFAVAARAYRKLAGLRPEDPVILRSLGLTEYLQGNYRDAAPPLERAAQLNPDLPGARLYLGISLFRTNRFAEAVETLKQAPERDGKNHLAPYWLGASYHGLGRFPQAIAELETARRLAPEDLEVLYLLARSYAERSAELLDSLPAAAPDSAPAKLLQAEDLFSEGAGQPVLDLTAEALESDPNLRGVHLLRGRVFLKREEYDQAAEEFRAELRVDPLSVEAHRSLAAYDLDSAEPAKALSHLLFLQKFRPDAPEMEEMLQAAKRDGAGRAEAWKAPAVEEPRDARMASAHAAYRSGRPREAAAELRKLLQADPNQPEIRRLLARSLEALGDRGSATEQWKALSKEQPNNPYVMYALGRAYDALSARTAEELFERYPNSYRVRMLRGEAFEKSVRGQSEFGKALAEYLKARELQPEAPGVNHAVGRMLWKMQRPGEAVPYLEQELEINPNHGLANYLLGKIHLARGQHEEAERYLESSLTAQPDLLDARRDLARAQMLLGRHEQAIGNFEDLVNRHPENASLHALLATAYRAAGRMEEAKASARKSQELRAEKQTSVVRAQP